MISLSLIEAVMALLAFGLGYYFLLDAMHYAAINRMRTHISALVALLLADLAAADAVWLLLPYIQR